MNVDEQHVPVATEPIGLPVWWRYVLVALATLILCSCRAESAKSQEYGVTERAQLLPPRPDVQQLEAERKAREGVITATDAHLVEPHVFSWGDRVMEGPSFEISDQYEISDECESDTYCCFDGYGRLIGPPDEYLCDGGDYGLAAGVRPDWTINGLEREDTIGHYDTLDGEVYVTPSNRVCIYAPRFAAVRRVVSLVSHERNEFINLTEQEESLAAAGELQPVASSVQRVAAAINRREQPLSMFRDRLQPGELDGVLSTMEARNLLCPYANLEIMRTGQIDGSEQALVSESIQSAVAWAGDEAAQVLFDARKAQASVGTQQVGIVYESNFPSHPKLRLVKMASTPDALPGEFVEFTLRFDNVGNETIGNVTIVDNLTTRLGYVPHTAQSTVEADFFADPNDTGASILRWEILEPLEPGTGGVLTFRAQVR